MSSLILPVLGGALVLYASLAAILSITQDAKEPPVIATTIPFITPLVGMTTRGIDYWVYLRDKYQRPIYTLRLPGARIYVINSTALIPAVQKPFRVLSFSPTLIKIAEGVMGLSKSTLEIVKRDPTANHGFILGFHGLTHRAVGPGPGLDKLNQRAVSVLSASLDKIAATGAPARVRMYDWLSGEILAASTEAVFGPHNPFRDPENVTFYHQYERGLIHMVLGIAPYAAKESLRARERLVKTVEQYYVNGSHTHPETSDFIKMRYDFFLQYDIPMNDIARVETAGTLGTLSNSIRTIFWLIWHILSDSVILRDCRQELAAAIVESPDGTSSLDIAYVKNSCPILFSTFQETCRFYGIGVSAREVLEDYMLGGQYYLKKGSSLIMPAAVQHTAPDVWGDNVGEFYYRRFMREEKRFNPVAFRGFGGGSTLCPGRHFASTEIIAFAALIIMRFDARPLSGSWTKPTVKNSNPATSIHCPDQDVDLELIARDDRKWQAIFSTPGKPTMVSAEDMEAN